MKVPATKTGIEAIEDATYRGASMNVTVSFSVPQAVKSAEAIERGLRARLLSAAFRNVLQWSEFQGGDVVVSPPFKWQKIINGSDYEPVSRMDVPVDEHYIEQLRRIPDFNRAYDVDGMTIEEFETFGPTAKTLRQFLNADADLDKLVRDIIVPEP